MSMMEWNSKTNSDWDWENFAIEIPKRVQRSGHDMGGNEVMDNRLIYSYSDFGHGSSSKSSISSSKQAIDGFVKDFREVDKNGSFPTCVGLSEPMIGLKLGRETYFEDACGTPTTNKTMPFSVMPKSAPPIPTTKRSRASYHTTHTPRCQVEGCSLDLGSAKEYHRRHRICESHSKSPKVIVAGMERRFCQQCSRFHDLSEFDEKKRSCRRRLSDHNARRRRPQTEAIPFRSTQLSSSLYDQRPRMNFLMSPFSIPVSNPTWDNDCSFKVGESRVNPLKGGAIERRPTFPSGEIPNNISMLHLDSDRLSSIHGITSQVLNHGSNASTIASNMDVAPEFQQALSLLSTNSWGLNEPEQPTPMDQLMHGNQITHSEPQKWALATSESLDLHNVGGTQFQEFQLFKTCDSFYSNQIN